MPTLVTLQFAASVIVSYVPLRAAEAFACGRHDKPILTHCNDIRRNQ